MCKIFHAIAVLLMVCLLGYLKAACCYFIPLSVASGKCFASSLTESFQEIKVQSGQPETGR